MNQVGAPGWPQPVYKVAKETPKLSNPIGRE